MKPMPWHEAPWSRLQARRRSETLPHALLLCGPAGLGKRIFAQRFIQGLLCERAMDGEACGSCRGCVLLAAGTHPDLVMLSFGQRKDGVQRSEIVVEQIRELSARLALRSQLGGWQIALIDPADAMNTAAANALLKTLEEPSAQTLLVLIADAPWRLPQTIRSRCQRIEFHPPDESDALAWLRAEAVADPQMALEAAGGSPGVALAWSGSGVFERRAQVRQDLSALAAGRGRQTEVARLWLDDEPMQRLRFAAQAAADECRARAANRPAPLRSSLDDDGLSAWYDAANRARDSLRGPLRGDLLLIDLLARWR